MKNKNDICHTLYCRNSVYLQVFFSLFQNFGFSGYHRDKRAKNGPKSKKKKKLSLALHISGTINALRYTYF